MSCEVRRVVVYDGAGQGIIPGMARYFSKERGPSPAEEWWNSILDTAARGRRRSTAFLQETGIVRPIDDASRPSQLELLFDDHLDDHPYYD